MAVTIGALFALGVEPSAWRSLDASVRSTAWQRPGGFHVSVAPGVTFHGWRCTSDEGSVEPPAASRAASGSCSYTIGPRVSVLCDGRIDSPRALGHQLGLGSTGSAADLLAEGYLTWGDRLPERLYGDFAAVVWDAQDRVLHLLRDHMGTKPLYHVHRPGRWLSVSSDIGFLLDHGAAGRDVDDASLARIVAHTAADDERTAFSQVARVPSATIVSCTADRPLRTRRYWRLEAHRRVRHASRHDCVDAFEAMLTRAVERRLAGGPVGAHLSGGLDSTAIASIAAERLAATGDQLITGSLTSHPSADGRYPTELPWIESALDWLDVEAHIIVDGRPLGLSDEALAGRPSSLPCGPGESVLRRVMADRGVRTVLSGWGGDEVATAPVSLKSLVRDRGWRAAYREVQGGRGHGLPALAGALLPVGLPGRPAPVPSGPLGRPDDGVDLDVAEQWLRQLGIAPRFARQILDARRGDVDRPIRDHRARMRQRLERGHIQQRIEEWAEADRKLGIECAYPLLDRELLELVVSLPADQLRHDGRKRSLMRDVLDGRTSQMVRERTDTTGATSDHGDRWRRWATTYEAHAEAWSRSDLVREHLDPDRLVAGMHAVIASWDRPAPPTDARRFMAPALARLMGVATFLASLEGTTTDVTDRAPVTSGANEARLPLQSR